MSKPSETPARGVDAARLHRTIFRLHFYAGIVVAPFLLVLALTGIVYLFDTEIDDALHPDWRFVSQPGASQPVEQLVNAALAAYPGATPTRIDLPTAPERTAVVFLKSADGEAFRVPVDPVSAAVRGRYTEAGSLVGAAGLLHGSLMLGDRGDRLVELVSCWAIVLILTGLYLWWPRGDHRLLGVWLPRLGRGRLFWRDLHAVAGVWGSLLLLFLLLSGLPWATNWGGSLNRAMASVGLGYPAAYRTHVDHAQVASDPAAVVPLAATTPGIPWTLEQAPSPHSDHAGHAVSAATPISVGRAAEIYAGLGLRTAYRLSYPKDAHDVYTAYTYPDRPQGQRTVHLDQYSGAVINDVGFADYGRGAQLVELGVQLHMGNYFGLPNQLLMLFASLTGALLAVSGPVMWLKRRRSGLGAPSPHPAAATPWGLAALLLALGLLFPSLGLSLVAVLATERLLLRRIAPLRDWLGLAP